MGAGLNSAPSERALLFAMRHECSSEAPGQDEVLGAARLVGVAGHFDGAVVGRGRSVDEALRVEGAGSAGAVGHAFGDAAAIGVHEPGKVKHFSKRHGSEIEVEAGDEYIMIGIEQIPGEEKEVGDELAFVDGDAFDALADFLFEVVDSLEDGPRIGAMEIREPSFWRGRWDCGFRRDRGHPWCRRWA